MERILRSLSRAKDRLGARIVHYSVQRDHLHLIVEAEDTRSLSRAMQGLSVRIAKALNRALGRKGKVFADRFHDRVLTSPRQVRHALAYVLCNARKHGVAPPMRGGSGPSWVDPCSSARGLRWLVPRGPLRGLLDRRHRHRGHCNAAGLAAPDRLASRAVCSIPTTVRAARCSEPSSSNDGAWPSGPPSEWVARFSPRWPASFALQHTSRVGRSGLATRHSFVWGQAAGAPS
jgi:REP element-mobilizing transposase RayT